MATSTTARYETSGFGFTSASSFDPKWLRPSNHIVQGGSELTIVFSMTLSNLADDENNVVAENQVDDDAVCWRIELTLTSIALE
ncbi:hypothetical protein M0R45_016205 [Rubus argutus]|uniref:Uncharacterized protein n=1 Tax=Rubus argutus TaxID=59490 RepID=A0AAW1XUE2_RUBAR